MIKTVIFDIDNTLYNFDAAHEAGMEAVCNYVYEQFGWVQYRKLEQLGLLQYCDFVVTSEESNADKPDSRFYSMCLKKAKCEPFECIYVGDNYWKDYRGSMDAGCADFTGFGTEAFFSYTLVLAEQVGTMNS